jgi:hypothetical protein
MSLRVTSWHKDALPTQGRRIVRTGPIPGLVFYRRRGARGEGKLKPR